MAKLRAQTKRPIVLKDTKPNVGIEQWYYEKLWKTIEAMHKSYQYFIVAASRKQDNLLASDASHTSELRKMMKMLGVRWSKKAEVAAKLISESFAEKGLKYNDVALRKKLKDVGFTVDFKMSAKMREAFNLEAERNVGLIKSVQAKFHSDVEQKVWASVESGGDVGGLAKVLQETYELTKKRARLIARDQNAKAHGLFEDVRRQELGLTKAMWVHSTAGKHPRESHVKADGKVYNLSQGLYVDGEYIRPGQKINCRCTSRAIIPGFDE